MAATASIDQAGGTCPVTAWLYSRNGGGDSGLESSPVGDLEPVREMLGSVARGLTIERHHRCRHAGSAPQLRAPAIPNRRDFNLVRTPANGFFEAMNVHVCCCPMEVEERR